MSPGLWPCATSSWLCSAPGAANNRIRPPPKRPNRTADLIRQKKTQSSPRVCDWPRGPLPREAAQGPPINAQRARRRPRGDASLCPPPGPPSIGGAPGTMVGAPALSPHPMCGRCRVLLSRTIASPPPRARRCILPFCCAPGARPTRPRVRPWGAPVGICVAAAAQPRVCSWPDGPQWNIDGGMGMPVCHVSAV